MSLNKNHSNLRLVQVVIAILDAVALVILADRAWLGRFGPLAERHANIQVGVDAPLDEPMVAYFDLHAGVTLVPARFLQTLVQLLQIPEMLGGVVLVAGYDLPDRVASLLVQVTLALDALDAVGCDVKLKSNFTKYEEIFQSKLPDLVNTKSNRTIPKATNGQLDDILPGERLHFL